MNLQKQLVSILTPCYNSAAYIGRMLDSVLQQTYPLIEVICIDDGSTDDTEKVIKNYIPKFQDQKKLLLYLKKEHKGQAAAINAGLKVMRGEYFGLLDSDDFLTKEAIEKRVYALEKHPDYAVIVSDYYIVKEERLCQVIARGNDYVGNLCYQPHQFYLCLLGYSPISSLGYLIRTEAMRAINPQMTINECAEGQNYQILLPLYYYYKRFYIDEPLGYYVVRKDSHAHRTRTREEQYSRNLHLLQMLEEILREMKLTNREIDAYKRMSIFCKQLEDM